MKQVKLGDYLLWDGKPAQIIGTMTDYAVVMVTLENPRCPHCGGELEKEQICMIPSSPLFQEKAEPIPTIQDYLSKG